MLEFIHSPPRCGLATTAAVGHRPPMTPWQRLYQTAEPQHGAFTVGQARAAGVAASTIKDRVHAGSIRRVQHSVLALAGSPDTAEQRLKAVELSIGHPVLLSSWSAAYLWGLVPVPTTRTHIVIPPGRRTPESPTVHATRSRMIIEIDHAICRGIAVTAPPMTLVTLAPHVSDAFLRGLVIDARQRWQLHFGALEQRVAALGSMPGTAAVRRVLADLDGRRPDSSFEYRVRDRLLVDGFRPLPDPEPCAVTMRDGRQLHVDVPFSPYKVGLECDGFGSHHQRSSLDIDALRHNGLTDVDWRILRVTWSTYEHHWDELVGQLSRLIATRPV